MKAILMPILFFLLPIIALRIWLTEPRKTQAQILPFFYPEDKEAVNRKRNLDKDAVTEQEK